MKQEEEYKDSLSAETITDDIDMRSYILGYLKGCEDSIKKFDELNKIQFSMPLREPYMKGGAYNEY